jgi:DNA invertase Pin-like site-specific DNA recombinase
MRIGYARVSTQEQNLDLQKDALRRAGCKKIIEDVASGKVENRPGLDRVLCTFHKFPAAGDRLANRATGSFFQLQP